jgi:hypothetical protein
MTRTASVTWRRRLFSTRRVVAYSVLYLVALTVGFSMSLTDRLVMIPSTQPIRLTDTERVEIPLEQGRRIELYRSRTGPIEPAAYALHFIGNADRAESIASLALFDWPGGGVDGYALNYPGYGQSTGPARLKSAAAAGLAAYDWLRTRAGGRPIYVAGSSLGTTVTSQPSDPTSRDWCCTTRRRSGN